VPEVKDTKTFMENQLKKYEYLKGEDEISFNKLETLSKIMPELNIKVAEIPKYMPIVKDLVNELYTTNDF